MRVLAPLACLLLALLAAPACGGDDDDGGSSVDAGPPDGGAATGGGIGARCAEGVACPADAPTCVVLSADATEGFCTKECGTTPEPPAGTDPTPPEGGTAMCQAGYAGTATPGCVFTLQAEGGNLPWACGLACGQTSEGDFGTCPSNLSCVQQAADQIGLCLPP